MSNLITPTDEQDKIIELSKIVQQMKISAYAGAAKTSTLVMVAQANPVKSLMLTFNKALADEARLRFPSHVECRTTHSLAYQHFGAQMREKLKRPSGAYKNVAGTGSEVGKYFKTGDFIYLLQGERESRRIKQGGIGVAIKETVARFEQSAEKRMTNKHVSCTPCDQWLLKDEAAMRAYRYIVLSNAMKLWDLRCDLRSTVLATHDTYLKLYQLSEPDLSHYDIIYMDESQDTNPVVLDIFLRQMGKTKLFAVGDQYQNIYSWRGAVNGMLELDWQEAELTKSFRFGQEIGDLADIVLANDGVIQTEVKGFEKLSTEVAPTGTYGPEVWENQYTQLFRTNGGLITEAVHLLDIGKVVNLEIDVSDFVKLLESAVALKRGEMNKVKHESLLQYESWKEFGEEAELIKGEALRVFKIVEEGKVAKILRVLSTHRNVENPDVILTTAHKSKGREWNIVMLGDDFPSCYDSEGNWVGLNDSERNLLYVALTRAKMVLGYNQTVEDLINHCKSQDSEIGLSFRLQMNKEIRSLERDYDFA